MDVSHAEELVGKLSTVRDPDVLGMAVWTLACHWEANLKAISPSTLEKAPEWRVHEHRLWALGEALRPLVRDRKWRGQCSILDTAAKILAQRKFGKGRQTFALLLGEWGRGAYAAQLAAALEDEDVCGHALSGLSSGKSSGYAEMVRPLLSHRIAWIRREAKKYIERFPVSGPS